MTRYHLRYFLLFAGVLLMMGCGRIITQARDQAEDMAVAKQPITEELELETDDSLPVPELTGTGIGTGRGVDLYWTPVGDADTYEIQAGKGGEFNETLIISLDDGESGHCLAVGLEDEEEYAFRIRTRYVKGDEILRSEWSSPVTQTFYEARVDDDVAAPFDITCLMDQGEGLLIK